MKLLKEAFSDYRGMPLFLLQTFHLYIIYFLYECQMRHLYTFCWASQL